MIRFKKKRPWMLCLSILAIVACTKYETPPPMAGDIPEADDGGIKRRVLWINIDGAVGSIVKANLPDNLKAMLPHSKYTFEALTDNRIVENIDAEDATNWTTMLTGMNASTHKVQDDSFIPDLDVNPNTPEQKVKYYPNIVRLITEAHPNAKTLCITSHRNLNGNMLNNAYRTVTSASDQEARDLVTASIENEDMTLTLVSFTGMLEAGKAGGFTASNSAYLTALRTIDGYIGECLAKINARERADKEDWLVVLTSGHGGKEDGTWGGQSPQERNGLCVFYYNHYASVEMKGQTLYGALFDVNNSATAKDPNQIYSAGEGRSLSVEAIIRFEQGPAGGYDGSSWQGMITKRSWSLHRQWGEVIFRMEAGENGAGAIQKNYNTLRHSLWQSFQLGIDAPTPTTKNFIQLQDGVIIRKEGSNTAGYKEDKNDLKIGGTNIPTPYYIAELRIWDKMLDDKTYADLSSQLNLQPTHPQYEHLIGYWKFSPDHLENGRTFKNQIEGMPDLVFNRDPLLAEFANTLPAQRKSGNLIMENSMIVPQLLYWLNAGQVAGMDGFNFIENFNHEEEWREQE